MGAPLSHSYPHTPHPFILCCTISTGTGWCWSLATRRAYVERNPLMNPEVRGLESEGLAPTHSHYTLNLQTLIPTLLLAF